MNQTPPDTSPSIEKHPQIITVGDIKTSYAFGSLKGEQIFIPFACGQQVDGKIGEPAFSGRKLSHTLTPGESIMAIIVPGDGRRRRAVAWTTLALWDAVLTGKPPEDTGPTKESSTTQDENVLGELPQVVVKFNSKDRHEYRVRKEIHGGMPYTVASGSMAQLVARIIACTLETEGTWLEQYTPKGWARVSTDPLAEAFAPVLELAK